MRVKLGFVPSLPPSQTLRTSRDMYRSVKQRIYTYPYFYFYLYFYSYSASRVTPTSMLRYVFSGLAFPLLFKPCKKMLQPGRSFYFLSFHQYRALCGNCLVLLLFFFFFEFFFFDFGFFLALGFCLHFFLLKNRWESRRTGVLRPRVWCMGAPLFSSFLWVSWVGTCCYY